MRRTDRQKAAPKAEPAAQAATASAGVSIEDETGVVAARQQGRIMAEQLGFKGSDLTVIATVISELARNILQYAGRGEVELAPTRNGKLDGIVVTARDEGPGIADVSRALEVGYSTSGGLGLGLPGVRRLMDALEVVSNVGRGTTVKATKWRR